MRRLEDGWKIGDVLVDGSGAEAMIVGIERKACGEVPGMYTLQLIDGKRLESAPGYLYKWRGATTGGRRK